MESVENFLVTLEDQHGQIHYHTIYATTSTAWAIAETLADKVGYMELIHVESLS